MKNRNIIISTDLIINSPSPKERLINILSVPKDFATSFCKEKKDVDILHQMLYDNLSLSHILFRMEMAIRPRGF